MSDDNDNNDDGSGCWDSKGFEEGVDRAVEERRKAERDSVVIDFELERLARLTTVIYERERSDAGKRLDIRKRVLDRLVDRKRDELKSEENKAQQPDPDELRRSAANIIMCDDVLGLFAKDFGRAIAGETVNGKLLYLVGTSRLFDRPMNAAIKGTSAGGKSEIRKRILEFFPPEDIVGFTSLSEKSLIYHDGDFVHKILSMGEATATEEQSFQDYLLRELMSEGYIRHGAAQKVGNEIKTVTIEKHGPVSFLVTTTKNKLHPENETRMLSLEIDDSEKQTRKVLNKVAQVHGLHDVAPIDYTPWRDFQRLLATGERRVVVPFAAVLVEMIPPVAVRLRRDVVQILCAIKAHALLHRDQRDRDELGRIVADIDRDYTAIRALMNAIVAEGSGVAVKPAIAETITAVRTTGFGMLEGEGANARDIAKLLKLDRSAAWRRLSAACAEGYIVNLETRRNMPGKYRVTTERVEPVAILPLTTDLAEACARVAPPPKIGEPCNRDEIAEVSQEDNGCKSVCTPDAPVHACNTVANSLATDKPLNGNGESPPVARFGENQGGSDARANGGNGGAPQPEPYPPVCQHCGAVSTLINPVSTCAVQGEMHLLHKACWVDWLNGSST